MQDILFLLCSCVSTWSFTVCFRGGFRFWALKITRKKWQNKFFIIENNPTIHLHKFFSELFVNLIDNDF